MATAPAQPVPLSIGRYVLHGEIAAGGMATVHFGRLVGPAGFSRAVAIKRLHAQFARDPEFVAMFLDEARLAARIAHPNVVATLDVVASGSELFLVMEYVRGAPLSRLTRAARARGVRIPPAIVASIVAGVLHGLHAAHEAVDEEGQRLDIVHRDVSPQNVLVGTDGVARVLDFGVAKAAGRIQTTRDGQLKGKLGYMAPEQARGAPVTRQTDIYAASVVLWEALTGERLFKADNDANALAKVLLGKVPRPSEIVTDLPASLDRVLLRGAAREPAERYATAREMARDLEAAIPCATPAEVGEWVTTHAADELSERAARIAEIERSRGSLPTVVSDVALGSNDPRTRADTPAARRGGLGRAGAVVAVALVVVLLGFAATFVRDRRSGGSTPARAASVTKPATATARATIPATSPTPALAPPVSGVTADTKRDAPHPSAPPPPPPPAATVTRGAGNAEPRPPKADCKPPYSTDERGHVHFKPECF